jgi:hypothetical protein
MSKPVKSKGWIEFYRKLYQNGFDESCKTLVHLIQKGNGRNNIHFLSTLKDVESLANSLNFIDFAEEQIRSWESKS